MQITVCELIFLISEFFYRKYGITIAVPLLPEMRYRPCNNPNDRLVEWHVAWYRLMERCLSELQIVGLDTNSSVFKAACTSLTHQSQLVQDAGDRLLFFASLWYSTYKPDDARKVESHLAALRECSQTLKEKILAWLHIYAYAIGIDKLGLDKLGLHKLTCSAFPGSKVYIRRRGIDDMLKLAEVGRNLFLESYFGSALGLDMSSSSPDSNWGRRQNLTHTGRIMFESAVSHDDAFTHPDHATNGF
tara:strand:+ start:552 stop:1289 length:738 start_codon:yes stop_codon:yes gene_type:complete